MSVWITGAWMAASGLPAQTPPTPVKEPQLNEAKGMPARASAGDYQAQVQAGAVTIAADFMGHAAPTADGVYNTEEYVVLETAFFGAPDARLVLAANDFSLRINGKKTASPSVPSVLVLKSLKDPNWEPPVKADAKSKTSFGGGGGGQNDPPPAPVHMPMELQHVMSQRVQKAALLEGDRPLPQAGLLFFQYRGKPEGIHSIELIYNGAAGQATLKLQP